ncbi:hypothetical protein [Prevotella sp.]|uniref:hypothetical protein n=1 Tax=Prevotella sp. TaxID=59823 RepID=UPI002F941F15
MDSSIMYFVYILIAVVVGVFLLKKVTSCLIKTVLGIILIAILAALYFLQS